MKNSDNTVLITGGASGIGLALAKEFLDAKNRVIICGRKGESLQKARQTHPTLITYQCDVADQSNQEALLQFIKEKYPHLNVLVNNAGIQERPNFAQGQVSAASVSAEIAINLTAPILLAAALLPVLQIQPESAIVNVTSGLAFCPLAEVPVYCATKSALHSFTLSLRHQLAETNVKVVEIAPPIVATALGGVVRPSTEGMPVMSAEAFASEAIQKFWAGETEILVGLARTTRSKGETMFSMMNH